MVVVATAAAASSSHVLVPPLHPMQDGHLLLAFVVRLTPATSPSDVDRVVLLVLLVVVARQRRTSSNDVVVTYDGS